MAEHILKFEGSVVVEGTFKQKDMGELKSYLERAVCLDVDFEQEGTGPFDNVAIGSIILDWESLN